MRLYKDGQHKDIPTVDMPAWLRAGWVTESELIAEPAESDPIDRYRELTAILETDGWRAIKDIADGYGITKPSGGWDEAIPLIIEVEHDESTTA